MMDNAQTPPADAGRLDQPVMALAPKRANDCLMQELFETRRPATPGPGMACGNCRYWCSWVESDDEDRGECRRYPPHKETDDAAHTWYGPQTPDHYWCGEYSPRHNVEISGAKGVRWID